MSGRRVVFVVQRYGAEIIGGAEGLCRGTARALAARGHEVRVLTTTAREYLHWHPASDEGTTDDDGVVVSRHHALAADPALAADLTGRIALGDHDWPTQMRWARAQGPIAPGILRALATETAAPVALWTYLYATTQLAIPLTRGRSIVVPTAHNEPPLRFGLTRGVMNAAAAFAFLTPEERDLVDDHFAIGARPHAIVGAAIAAAQPGDATRVAGLGIAGPYVLYVGRMDPGKGVDDLLACHAAYRAAGGRLTLVFAGPGDPPRDMPDFALHLGRVPDRVRSDLLAGCTALVMPSRNESYSLVLVEAWSAGRPTLGTAHSPVIAGQTARSGGGLVYLDPAGYSRQLERLERDVALGRRLGAAGRAWAAEQTWDRVADRWEELLDRVVPTRG